MYITYVGVCSLSHIVMSIEYSSSGCHGWFLDNCTNIITYVVTWKKNGIKSKCRWSKNQSFLIEGYYFSMFVLKLQNYSKEISQEHWLFLLEKIGNGSMGFIWFFRTLEGYFFLNEKYEFQIRCCTIQSHSAGN